MTAEKPATWHMPLYAHILGYLREKDLEPAKAIFSLLLIATAIGKEELDLSDEAQRHFFDEALGITKAAIYTRDNHQGTS